jgi:long-subunit acyl-CoA synthetase (AMP-forming)
MLLKYCDDNKLKLNKLKKTIIGGSAVPRSMIEKFWNEHGVEVMHGWGMTELHPLGTLTPSNIYKDDKLSSEEKL